MRGREMGCSSRFAKVPELISRPNDATAIITSIAGHSRKGKIKRTGRQLEFEPLSSGTNQMEKLSTNAATKLGSNRRISLRR